MGVSSKAAGAYALFKKTRTIHTYGKLMKEAVDADTRPGALMKLSIRTMLDLASRALGVSLTSHPYFAYHRVHIEAIAQAMNAASNRDRALETLNRAIRSADAAGSLKVALSDYRQRKNALKQTYGLFLAGSVELLRNYKTNPQAAREMKDAGHTPESLKAWTDRAIYEWRATWCELYQDCLQLLAMAHAELRCTEAAMANFEARMKALFTGGLFGRSIAPQVEVQRLLQQYGRRVTPGGGSERAVEDPVGFARDQARTIETVADALGECCEIAMSDDAYRAPAIAARIGTK